MPYCKLSARVGLISYTHPLKHWSVGQLTYVLYRIALDWAHVNGAPNYARWASALGALESTKLELYRRHVAPYEDSKIAENGDVLPQECP